jgi:putative transposase
MRYELLDGEIFDTLREAQIIIEKWRIQYNTIRPHMSLGHRAPVPETTKPDWEKLAM